MTIDQEVDIFLEHFGKKGMKWGQRNTSKPSGGSKKGPSNRQLNKASRKTDRTTAKTERKTEAEDWAKQVDTARANVASGKNKADWKKAKGEHKANKKALGSREARKILNGAKWVRMDEIETSQQARDGKEEAARIATALSGQVLIGLLSKA